MLEYQASVCKNCPSGCRSCTLDQNLSYTDENAVCTSCLNPENIIFEQKCQERCPSGSQKIKVGSVYKCEIISCSDLCDECVSLKKCGKCKKLDPNLPGVGVIQTYDGQCVRCLPTFGLTTKIDPVSGEPSECQEICGDSIFHKETKEMQINLLKTQAELDGGLKISTDHTCDDGNNKSGDGCSSTCQVEEGNVCRQIALALSKQVSKCISKTEIHFSKSESSLVPLTFELNFSRDTNLDNTLLFNRYYLVMDTIETLDTTVKVGGIIDYTLFQQSKKQFIVRVNGDKFLSNLKGTMKFTPQPAVSSNIASSGGQGSSTGSRLVQSTIELDDLEDDEGMPVEIESARAEIDFNYDEYNWEKGISSIVKTINNFLRHPISQMLIFLIKLNHLIFSFSANIFNKFVYFRGLKTVIPINLEATYSILGSGLDLKTSQTDYDNPEEYEKTGLDKMLGIDIVDQDPPVKFKAMGYTDIYIKSALPILLINFSVYLFVLLLISINNAFRESEVTRIKQIASKRNMKDAKKDKLQLQPSALKKAIMTTFRFAELHFKWSAMIRMNLLIY